MSDSNTGNHAAAPVVVRWSPASHTGNARPGVQHSRRAALAAAVGAYPGQALLLAREGIPLDDAVLNDWARALSSAPPSIDAITGWTNRNERLNPFREYARPPTVPADADPASLVWWLGEGRLLPCPVFPDDLLLLRPHAARRVAKLEHWPKAHDPQLYGLNITVADHLWLGDGHKPFIVTRPQAEWQAAPSDIHAPLSIALRRLTEQGIWRLRRRDPQRPLLLHITHSWGGGISRWVNDWRQHDDQHDHLILRSHGDWQSGRHGSRLSLGWIDRNQTQPVLIRDFHLTPPITATRPHDAAYQAIMQWLTQRFQVARVLVSSLIGHSLDALDSGLPTIQVLHDYYPAWPLLTVNPLAYAKNQPQADESQYDLARALSENRPGEFVEDDALIWQRLTRQWLNIIEQQRIQLVSPTQTARQVITALVPQLRGRINAIGHGLPDWQYPAEIKPRKRTDESARQPLRLVVPGKLMAHKGLQLLLEASPELTQYARIILLGCDRAGMALLGRGGIDVIGSYDNAQLPALMAEIQPDAALLLSVVPETYSYTLSELWSLGVAPIATRLGSFVERIEDGHNGLLIEPTADALIALVKALHADRQPLENIREQLANRPRMAMSTMLMAYEALWPATGPVWQAEPSPLPLAGEVAELLRHGQWIDDELHDLRQQHDQLYQQFLSRDQWLRRTQAEVVQLQARMDEQRTQLERDLQARHATIEKQQRKLEQLNQTLFEQAAQLRENVHDLASLRDQLQHSREYGESIQQQLEQILASRSWRLTRPLRALARFGRNVRRARIHQPWRWPFLAKRLLQSLLSQGMGGTLRRLQLEHETAPGAHTETLTASVEVSPINLRQSLEPRLGILIQAGASPAAISAQLKAAAALTEEHEAFTVLVGDIDDKAAQLIAECQGVVHARPAADEPSTNHRIFELAVRCLEQHQATRPMRWLHLPAAVEPMSGSLTALLNTLDQYPTQAVICGLVVDDQRHPLDPRPLPDAMDQPVEHPLNAFVQSHHASTLAARVISLTAASSVWQAHGANKADSGAGNGGPPSDNERDLTNGNGALMLPSTLKPVGETSLSLDDKINAVIEHQGVLLQPESLALWLKEQKPTATALNEDEQQPTILIIDSWVPTPDQDSGSLRMVHMLQLLRELGWRVVFCAADRTHRGMYTSQLQRMGIEVWYTPYLQSFSQFLSAHGGRFKAVMLSRYYVARELLPTVKAHCPFAQVIFDTVDLHFLREEREAELKNSSTLKRLAAATRKQELALVENCEITLVVSPAEQQLLRGLRPRARVEVLSNIHELHGCRKDYQERSDMMFVGGFQHPPNVDAMKWFISDIWPRIHAALPEVRMRIIGSKMPEEIRRLEAPNVDILGFVAELRPHLDECRLAVAPLRYGAGVKGKVNSSMSHGQPVVATTIATEGMGLNDGDDVLVADEAEQFAAAVIRLYADETLWQRLSQGGLENIRRHFSREAAAQRLRSVLNMSATPTRPDQQQNTPAASKREE